MHEWIKNDMHLWLIEIFNDFCSKHDMPKNKDGEYLSASDILQKYGSYIVSYREPLTIYQTTWLENYIYLWEGTNGGEDL